MIITRTPFRVSFFGGGTDYPEWFNQHGGAVLGTTVDKYCYIMVRKRPSYFKNKYRIVYRQEEFVDKIDDIEHPSVRECIRYSGIKEGLEVVHWSDLPARKGMGASSAFTVGMLKALYAKGEGKSPYDLAKAAIFVEQNCIRESVGWQDQIHSAYGGFNLIEFTRADFNVKPYHPPSELGDWLILVDTGDSRIASDIASQIQFTPIFYTIGDIVSKAQQGNIYRWGKLLDESWELKKKTASVISNTSIDKIYDKAIKAGALGGKLLGAGAGGFMLFIAPPDKHSNIIKRLGLHNVNIKFSNEGSKIIYSDAS